MHQLDAIRNFQADQGYLIRSEVSQPRHIMPITPLYFSMNNNAPVKIGQISAWKLALLANFPAEILLSKKYVLPQTFCLSSLASKRKPR
jgi:hypothetical protein